MQESGIRVDSQIGQHGYICWAKGLVFELYNDDSMIDQLINFITVGSGVNISPDTRRSPSSLSNNITVLFSLTSEICHPW